jgi:hypothetical protein
LSVGSFTVRHINDPVRDMWTILGPVLLAGVQLIPIVVGVSMLLPPTSEPGSAERYRDLTAVEVLLCQAQSFLGLLPV